MCGIAGLLDPRWRGTSDELSALAERMAASLSHRGPDDDGAWCDAEAGVGFGHRRLSVIDLSPAGHQPMVSADGRWVVSYNGECYNAAEIRSRLPGRGRVLRGHCDTEVVVEAVSAWGPHTALERINGMFALALWDRQQRVLHLVRDRLGEKPLYYAIDGGLVLFGSELRALAVHPRFERKIDREALALYLRLSYIPAPFTIYSTARKLAAGSMVTIRWGETGWPEPSQWWDFSSIAESASGKRAERTKGGDISQGVVDELERLLRDSVGRRLVADVPLGAFLSGGIDSTLVTALAQASASQPIKTFTVGFGGEGHDETAHAAAVAKHLGTDHTEMHLSPDDALAAVGNLHRCWDEPFADPSGLPTLLLCQQARHHVTVALSGDGGDEVFGGYRRYTAGSYIAHALPVPRLVRRAGSLALRSLPRPVFDRFGSGVSLANQVHKLSGALGASSVSGVFTSLVSAWDDAEAVVIGHSNEAWAGPPELPWHPDAAEAMMAWDTMSTLPDEMLTKVDRASMSFGLEVRVPLLDHRIVEAAWELPAGLRVARGRGKRALRLVLDRYVPRQLVERPKTGFDPPIAAWLRGPLREWAEGLLSQERLVDQGLLDPARVRSCWSKHISGHAGMDYSVWAVLVFQAWLDGQEGRQAINQS